MALTLTRWIGLAVGGMLAVLMLLSYEPKERVRTPAEIQMRKARYSENVHGQLANRLARDYRTAVLADSLRMVSRAVTVPVRVTYGSTTPADIRRILDTLVARASGSLGTRVGIDVVALVDSVPVAGHVPWGTNNVAPFFVLPTRPGDRCTVVLPMGTAGYMYGLRDVLKTEDAQLQIFGPCRYYATFGLPGAPIYEWLRQRGALLALGGSWTHASTLDSPDRLYNPYYSDRPDDFYPAPSWHYFYYSARAVNCFMGDARACESAVVEKAPGNNPRAVGSAVRVGFTLGPVYRRSSVEFSGRETELLADMLRAMGRERFARFWASTDPMPVAFQKASGMSLGEWIVTWASEDIGMIRKGPTARTASVLMALIVAGLCIALSMLAARRREFA
jgi:hypothetical protein